MEENENLETNEEISTENDAEDIISNDAEPSIEGEEDDNSNSSDNESDESAEAPQGKFDSLEAANKSYAELEKKYGEQSNEVGSLRKQAELAAQYKQQLEAQALKQAQENGFNTVADYQKSREVAAIEADEYLKHVRECDYPDEMVRLLDSYRNNPDKETLDMIESQFSVDTLKQVAANVTIAKGQLQAKEQEALNQQVYDSAKSYLEENVTKYKEEFENPAFAAMYAEAFKGFGCDLDTPKFVSLMKNFADSIIANYKSKSKINAENEDITNEIAGDSNAGSSQPAESEKDILTMTEAEMRREFRKY